MTDLHSESIKATARKRRVERPLPLPTSRRKRLAVVVSHPIQYYAPLHQRLAQCDDLAIKVFFTWHAGMLPVHDRGFEASLQWDVPLNRGYECELIANTASDPGTHHFFGLRNPSLVDCVLGWNPDAVHVTGWAWASHLRALHAFRRRGVPILFRGDSHLLDASERGPRWMLKHKVLQRVYSWPSLFLVVGSANRAYYQAFGANQERLFFCTHSIDVERFAAPAERYEREARAWRCELGISTDSTVLLYAGKFERKKRPLELMRAVSSFGDSRIVLVLVGSGELQSEIEAFATSDPARFRVLPFQNQSRMPIVYRLGDLFILPSGSGESWGLAVNEAMASSRPVLVSDRVGCAADVVEPSCGRVFRWNDPSSMIEALKDLTADPVRLGRMRIAAAKRARAFDISHTESAVRAAVHRVTT